MSDGEAARVITLITSQIATNSAKIQIWLITIARVNNGRRNLKIFTNFAVGAFKGFHAFSYLEAGRFNLNIDCCQRKGELH